MLGMDTASGEGLQAGQQKPGSLQPKSRYAAAGDQMPTRHISSTRNVNESHFPGGSRNPPPKQQILTRPASQWQVGVNHLQRQAPQASSPATCLRLGDVGGNTPPREGQQPKHQRLRWWNLSMVERDDRCLSFSLYMYFYGSRS